MTRMPEPFRCLRCGAALEIDANYCGPCFRLEYPDAADGPLLPGHFLPPGCRAACEPDCAGWDYDGLL